MGKANIILTNSNLKFTIHNLLLFPVVLRGMSHSEQSQQNQKKHSLNFFKNFMSCLDFSKIKNIDIVLHERYFFHPNRDNVISLSSNMLT